MEKLSPEIVGSSAEEGSDAAGSSETGTLLSGSSGVLELASELEGEDEDGVLSAALELELGASGSVPGPIL